MIDQILHVAEQQVSAGRRSVSSSPPGGNLNTALNPVQVFLHPGVDAVHPLTAAVLGPGPGHQAEHGPPPPRLHHERPPAVPQAGVSPTLEETRTKHVVCDVVADGAGSVAGLTFVLRDHWQLHVLQEVRGQRGRGGGSVGDPPTSN